MFREISKKINLAHTSVKKHILTLLKENLIIKKQELFVGYSTNLKNGFVIYGYLK